MKTIITLLAATMLVAGAAGAMAADRQRSDDAINTDLTWQAAREGFGSPRIPAGARASVRVPLHTRTGISQRSIDFQAQGAGQ